MAEMALVSSKKIRLKQLADDGNRSARAALRLAEDPNQFLSTVQVGITLGGVLAGAFGGNTIATRIAPHVEPWLGTYAYSVSFGIVVTCITFTSIVIGELVPKRLGMTHPETIAMSVSGFMRFTTKAFAPVIFFLSITTNLIFRLMQIAPRAEQVVTDHEIKELMSQGTESGQFHEAEAEIVTMALRLGDRRVSGLMTSRAVMDYLDSEEVPEVNRRKIIDSPHSRFPVFQGGLEHVLGMVQVKDILATLLAREEFDVKAAVQPAPFIPENAPALKALELFKSSGAAMALVVDEYGAITGLLTLNDIMQALVGDIVDPTDNEDAGAVRRDDGSWLVDGILPIDELHHLLEIRNHLDGNGEYNTVAGFVLTHLNRVAKVADHVDVQGYRFEVLDMDGRRIDKVLIVPPVPTLSDEDAALASSGNQGPEA
ncbi:MAG: HlyC/CorC family transporter [Clostridia bacterium]|nr:HlyC/CorC family transporter [Deltaproteobacteria bacterium]